MKTNVLPTTENLEYYLHLKEESNKQKPTDLLSPTLDAIMQIWESSSLPIAFKSCVTELMEKKLKNHFDLQKSVNRKETENFKKNVAVAFYLIYRYANAHILQIVLVQKRKSYPSRSRTF